jgi:hypothetical protein
MATVDKVTASRIIQGGGIYPGDDDMPVIRVVRFKDGAGRIVFGIVYLCEADIPSMLFRYDEPTRYIHDPTVIWRHQDWLMDPVHFAPVEEVFKTLHDSHAVGDE